LESKEKKIPKSRRLAGRTGKYISGEVYCPSGDHPIEIGQLCKGHHLGVGLLTSVP